MNKGVWKAERGGMMGEEDEEGIVDAATNNTLIDTCQPGACLVLAYTSVMRRRARAPCDGSAH